MKKKIAIIGSGIAGLTIANLFKINSNFEVTVYEKEKTGPPGREAGEVCELRPREGTTRRRSATPFAK